MLKISLPLLASILLLPSCNLMQGNSVEVTNRSDSTLTDVRFAFADDAFERSSLAPGETFSISPSPDRDGGISLSYTLDGKIAEHELGYAAPPISMTCKFEVVGSDVRGDCKQN
jgi:hypothetical protein